MVTQHNQESTMKKVFIDPGCITCGTCEFIAQDVFEVLDVSYVKKGVDWAKHKDLIKQAAAACPVSVIKYEE